MRHFITLGLLALGMLLAGSALAADVPVSPKAVRSGCSQYTLCDAEADAALPCKNSGATGVMVARLAGNYTQTLYATQATATTFSCHLFSSDNGYSATLRQQITAVALSETQYVITIEGPLDYEWIECSAIADNQVTITSLACPVGR
jgi:hypothetical protein